MLVYTLRLFGYVAFGACESEAGGEVRVPRSKGACLHRSGRASSTAGAAVAGSRESFGLLTPSSPTSSTASSG